MFAGRDGVRFAPLPLDYGPNEMRRLGGAVVQRVGTSRMYAVRGASIDADFSAFAPVTPSAPLDVAAAWPAAPTRAVDLSLCLDPHFLARQYEATLHGEAPLPAFPKRALARARVGLPRAQLLAALSALFVDPAGLDARHAAPEFVRDVQARLAARDDARPVSAVLHDLKQLETRLLVLVGLELHTLDADCGPALTRHFNRLCIWQAVGSGGDALLEFCMQVVVPFYKSVNRAKTKEFLRVCRGVHTKPRPRPPPLPAPSVALPALARLARPPSPPPEPTPRAARAPSHPVFRASRQNTVEVRFSRRSQSSLASRRSSTVVLPAASQASQLASQLASRPASRQDVHETRLARPAKRVAVEATPAKVRTTLHAFEPVPLEWEVGSTDSD